jgi:hypothetical protein
MRPNRVGSYQVPTSVIMPSSEAHPGVVITNSTSMGRIFSDGADCESQNMVTQGGGKLEGVIVSQIVVEDSPQKVRTPIKEMPRSESEQTVTGIIDEGNNGELASQVQCSIGENIIPVLEMAPSLQQAKET